jgi:prephenate dehydrogenase
MRFKRIAIFGLGLIGGSFALAARQVGLADKITGWDNSETLEAGLSRGLIDGIEEAFGAGEKSDADLIYLAAPVGAIIEFISDKAGSLKPGALVTDAGSVKREICAAARASIPEDVFFVGGHPMAGSHKRGMRCASSDLFSDAAYAVVPRAGIETLDETQAGAVNTIIEIARKLGSRPVVLSAEKHDRAVAQISHLPQLVSTSLAVAAARMVEGEAQELAGSGFDDMTRLAQSDWAIWEDICRSNFDEIAAALDVFAEAIETTRSAIRNKDFQGAQEAFRAANAFMNGFQTARSVAAIKNK